MDYNRLISSIGLSAEGVEIFNTIHSKIADESFKAGVIEAYDAFKKGNDEFTENALSFAKSCGELPEHLLLYLHIIFSEAAYKELSSRGIGEEYFYSSLLDLDEKCSHNKEENGIYGIPAFEIPWFRYAMCATIFKLGRLQFQIAKSEYDVTIDGVSISKGDTCYFVHVPSGEPLTEEACLASYKTALEFFTKYYGVENMMCFCYSWLLQPWLDGVLKPDTNIIKFKNSFKLIETIPSIPHTFRFIFMKQYDSLDDYPTDNPLRKTAVERRKRGDLIGYGVGVRLINKEILDR
ncbi:MAG: hypothetical protein IJE25_08605 [Clostridia bacterium]|nr:hypothetical protein [Clostridia bacterium]